MYFSPFSWSYTLPYSCFSCRCLATVPIHFLTFLTTPSNLNATISFLTNSDSTGSLFFYTANGKYLSACLNLTLFHLVTIITPYHCNSLSYSLRSPISFTSRTSSILLRRVSMITIVPYLFSDLSILPITFHCYTNPTVSHHHFRKYRNLFLFLLLILGDDVERNPGPISVSS